ncbi:MAG: hypothetical protein HZRFUVUK_000694 [Candidatus Fervidibacterota bacterium]|jgi:threonine dehydrogenase-like Zn-dependent dehydrogenase
MLAIQYRKSLPLFLLSKLLGKRFPHYCIGWWSPTRLVELEEQKLPSPNWVRVKTLLAGICGSDIDVITSRSSFYFAPITSYPFVLGHEAVGRAVEVGSKVSKVKVGDRVVLEPALSCPVRELKPCPYCEAGLFGNCERITEGIISSGVQTGYCRDTGGAWSECFVAHEHQLHLVPDEIPDEVAVLVEPFSCAMHAVLRARPSKDCKVLVIGCGTIGLMTIKSLRLIGFDGHISAIAKYPHQREWAKLLGADVVVKPDKWLYDELGAITEAKILRGDFGICTVVGGYDVVFDCVASSQSINDAIKWTRARGKLILVGMPSIPKGVDLAPVWHKELHILGSYAYGVERIGERKIHTIDLVIEMLLKEWREVRGMLTHTFPLTRYREAIAVSARPGRHKAIKVAFDMRQQ